MGKIPQMSGPNGIPSETLKADIQTSTETLYPLLRQRKEICHPATTGWKLWFDLFQEKFWQGLSWRGWRSPLTKHFGMNKQASVMIDHARTTLQHYGSLDSLEWQPLYTVFQKVFDSVDRYVVWRLMYYLNSRQVRLLHQTTVWRCHLSSLPWGEADRTLHWVSG